VGQGQRKREREKEIVAPCESPSGTKKKRQLSRAKVALEMQRNARSSAEPIGPSATLSTAPSLKTPKCQQLTQLGNYKSSKHFLYKFKNTKIVASIRLKINMSDGTINIFAKWRNNRKT
jgi:hypothetical protein